MISIKLNILFLAIGLVLSLVSKVLQYNDKIKLGNGIVIPAAIFLICGIIFSLPKVRVALEKANGLQDVIVLSIWACLGVVSFQLMMMILVGNGNKLALLLILPVSIAIYFVVQKWRML